jgi:hypothetical protein
VPPIMKEALLEKELKDLHRKLDLILEHLGIGKVPPKNVLSLKEKAAQKARERYERATIAGNGNKTPRR